LFNSVTNKNHNSDLPVLAISQEHGAIPRHLIDYKVSVTDKSLESYKIVEVGDFIISLRSFQGGIEYSTYKGICSPAYIILKPIVEIERLFYKYYFKTDKYIIELNKKLAKANVFADKDQMVRTFNNLIKNALQAIPEERQGRIVITVDQLENNVRIRISDNGTGISDDKRLTIFVPYFTTKSNGTGLGLAMVKQIIDNHNGLIYFEANHPEGTTFTVELPLVKIE
jgi:signal transduction histidine kinase